MGCVYVDPFPYGSYTLHGTGTGTGTGTIENNGSLFLFLSLCTVYSTQHNIETHRFPVPVPVSVPCSVNELLGLQSLGDSFGKMITNSLVILPFNKMYHNIYVHMHRWLISLYNRTKANIPFHLIPVILP